MSSNKQVINPNISNPLFLLNLAGKAMASKSIDKEVIHKIGFWKGELVCLPFTSVTAGMITCDKLSPYQLKKGLTAEQWNRLGSKLSIEAWRLKLCPKLPAPYQVPKLNNSKNGLYEPPTPRKCKESNKETVS